MERIQNRTKTIIIAGALILAILTGIAYMAYANAETNNTNTNPESNFPFGDMNRYFIGNSTFVKPGQFGGKCGRGLGPGMTITVSEAFKQNVLSIAESDSDVKQLLANGYNVTMIKPIIQTIVEGDGTVVTKATSAIVILQKDTTGYAYVWVDLTAAKVTRIEIITRTIIDKT